MKEFNQSCLLKRKFYAVVLLSLHLTQLETNIVIKPVLGITHSKYLFPFLNNLNQKHLYVHLILCCIFLCSSSAT